MALKTPLLTYPLLSVIQRLMFWSYAIVVRHGEWADRMEDMLPGSIAIDRQAIASVCRAYGAAKLSLFGSALRSDFDPNRSDVDVLVEFAPGARQSLFQLLKMQAALSELFGRPVDLTTPGSLSKYFRQQVLSTAEVLYDAA
jgi:uncharacterized protein